MSVRPEDFSPGQATNCPTCGGVFTPIPLPPLPLPPPAAIPQNPRATAVARDDKIKPAPNSARTAALALWLLGAASSFVPMIGVYLAVGLFSVSCVCAFVVMLKHSVASGVVIMCLNVFISPLLLVSGQLVGGALLSEAIRSPRSDERLSGEDYTSSPVSQAKVLQESKPIDSRVRQIDPELLQRANNLVKSGYFDVEADPLTGDVDISPRWDKGENQCVMLRILDTGDGDPVLTFEVYLFGRTTLRMRVLEVRIGDMVHRLSLDGVTTANLKYLYREGFRADLKEHRQACALVRSMLAEEGPLIARITGAEDRRDFQISQKDIALMKGVLVMWEARGGVLSNIALDIN